APPRPDGPATYCGRPEAHADLLVVGERGFPAALRRLRRDEGGPGFGRLRHAGGAAPRADRRQHRPPRRHADELLRRGTAPERADGRPGAPQHAEAVHAVARNGGERGGALPAAAEAGSVAAAAG